MKLKLFFVGLLISSVGVLGQNLNEHGGIYGFSQNLVYVVSDNGYFFKSENGGLSWDQYNSGVNVEFYDLNFYDENLGFAVGQEGKILKTSNAGQTWAEVASGTSNDLYAIGIGSLNNIFVVGSAGTVLQSTDGGESWNTITGISSERLNHINFKDANTAFIAGDNGTLLYTENAGTDWQTLDAGTTDNYYIASVTDNSVHVLSGPERDYLFREGQNGLASSNNVDWNMYSMDLGIPAPISGFHFQNDNEGYAVHSADLVCECCYIEILKTNDGGTNWESIYLEEFGMNGCNTEIGYSDISFADDDYGYLLIGDVVIIITPPAIFTTNIFLGIEDFKKEANFLLYPNPAQKIITLQLKNREIENISVSIFDVTGKKIFSNSVNSLTTEINISDLSSGLYFVSLKQNGKNIGYQKLIKN